MDCSIPTRATALQSEGEHGPFPLLARSGQEEEAGFPCLPVESFGAITWWLPPLLHLWSQQMRGD